MVEAHRVQDRRVEVVPRIGCSTAFQPISSVAPKAVPAFSPAPPSSTRTVFVVVPSGSHFVGGGLRERRATELRREQHQRVFQQAPPREVLQQSGDGRGRSASLPPSGFRPRSRARPNWCEGCRRSALRNRSARTARRAPTIVVPAGSAARCRPSPVRRGRTASDVFRFPREVGDLGTTTCMRAANS